MFRTVRMRFVSNDGFELEIIILAVFLRLQIKNLVLFAITVYHFDTAAKIISKYKISDDHEIAENH